MIWYDNQATRIRKEVLVRVARAVLSDRPYEMLDRIPFDMRPREMDSSRCCIYKDRQVLKYRTMAAMGFGSEDETDELTPLHEYYERALKRTEVENVTLSVLDIACSACIQNQYLVTNACRGCLGRACQTNCPKDAIDMVKGCAVIDPERCVNCGLCLKACPYKAIVRVPVPCEEVCPVNAISKDASGKEVIDPERCTSCGQCTRHCPFAAIQERSQIVDVLQLLKSGRKSAALLAPSVVGQFPGDLPKLAGALKKLGFTLVEEVAAGADETARCEAIEWQERIEGGAPFMTTSCCPAYAETVEKHLPEVAPFVSHTPTPMAFSARMEKADDPEVVTVFIGPCLAKRVEGFRNPDVDYVLTFDELDALLTAAAIRVEECESVAVRRRARSEGRGFPVVGGVAAAVQARLPDDRIAMKPLVIQGLDSKALIRLKMAATRGCEGNLVEVMCCAGGCMGGPGVLSNPAVAARKLTELLKETPPPEAG